uniref:RRM domain-containing protein n=1 Tax=Paramoeba aestuarina TaxID=180227 RepID=A0A7S4JRG4_9EUKA
MAANDFGVDLQTLDRTVYVTNIAPTASIEKLSEFFGFCGKIRSLRLRKVEENNTQEALIEFDAPSASKTALMLKDALIEGVPICVASLSADSLPPYLTANANSTPVHEANLDGQRYADESGEQNRSSTSVVASLLGAGYTLGNNAFQSAVEYDKQNHFSEKASEIVHNLSAQAAQYDEQYGVSTSVNNLWETTKAMTAPYVESTVNATAPYVEAAKVTATNTTAAVMANPSVQATVDTVNASVANLGEETKKDIERRQNEQQRQQQSQAQQPQEGAEVSEGVWDGGDVKIM